MSKRVRTSLPDDDYLCLIGQLAYMVTSMEGLLMFDLPELKAYLPEDLSPERLAGKTTRGIGQQLVKLAEKLAITMFDVTFRLAASTSKQYRK